jgi:hypothetical protein
MEVAVEAAGREVREAVEAMDVVVGRPSIVTWAV